MISLQGFVPKFLRKIKEEGRLSPIADIQIAENRVSRRAAYGQKLTAKSGRLNELVAQFNIAPHEPPECVCRVRYYSFVKADI